MNSVRTEKLNLDKNNIIQRKTFNETFYATNHFFLYFSARGVVLKKSEHRQKIHVGGHRIHFAKFNEYRYG